MSKYFDYASVPWLRRSSTNSGLLILHVVTLGCVPFLLVTGDIYYDEVGDDGTLKVWSGANRVIAYLLLLAPLVLIGVIIATLAGL
jgi:hypothetical protein